MGPRDPLRSACWSCRPFALTDLDDYEKHFTVMNYDPEVVLKQVGTGPQTHHLLPFRPLSTGVRSSGAQGPAQGGGRGRWPVTLPGFSERPALSGRLGQRGIRAKLLSRFCSCSKPVGQRAPGAGRHSLAEAGGSGRREEEGAAASVRYPTSPLACGGYPHPTQACRASSLRQGPLPNVEALLFFPF